MNRSLFLAALAIASPLSISAAAQEVYRLKGTLHGQLGFSIDSAGDVNNDGIADFICGRPHWQVQSGGQFETGAQVFSGADGTLLLSVSSGDGQGAGYSVAGLGDLNGDGHDDVAVGIPNDNSLGAENGAVKVYSGLDGALLMTLNGTPQSFFGSSVAGVGDFDGDGIPDLAVGSPQHSLASGSRQGRVAVFSGQNGSLLFEAFGSVAFESMGSAVSAAGDVNGDGFADLFVGSPGANIYGASAGLARVYSGANGSVLHEFGGTQSSSLGYRLNLAGDVNGDGVGDLIAGYDFSSSNSRGKARVYSGSDGTVLLTVEGGTPGDQMGRSVSGAGDVNGDGFGDIVVGGPGGSYTYPNAGVVRVYSGLDGTELFQWHGEASLDLLGWSVASVGDLTGDGLSEVIIAAEGAGSANDWSGVVRVMSPVVPPVAEYCFADQGSFLCPCGNDDALAGCANSTGQGARLSSSGSQSVSIGDQTVAASGLPTGSFGLLFKGTEQVQLPLSDGIRCVGGDLVRLKVFLAGSSGTFNHVLAQGTNGLPVPGVTDYLQIWYRDFGTPCGLFSNLSNGVRLPWRL